ncbi:MAG: replication factor A [Halobacteriaceae archaeon]
MSDVREHAAEIHDQFEDDLDVTEEDVADRLQRLVSDYSVPLDEARRSVENHYLDEAGLSRDDLAGGSESVDVASIDRPEQWVDLTATVVDLWEARSDAVAQVGLLGDETGTIKFTSWAKSDVPTLEEGEVYRLGSVVTDEYEGRFSVKLNSTTTVEHLPDEEIEVGNDDQTFEGALVAIQSGSGLIKRCPEEDCTRVLQNGRCSEHGEVEGSFDLRIKGVLDDGETVQEVIFDREATEALADTTLEDAKQRAMDALDTTVVADDLRDQLLGRYFSVTGPAFGRYLLADDTERLSGPVDHDAALIKARSM